MAPLSMNITEADLVFEEDLLRMPGDLKTWFRYMEAKRMWLLEQNVSGVEADRTLDMLYERALAQVPVSYRLWSEYLERRMERVLAARPRIDSKALQGIIAVFERCLQFMFRMPRVWIDYYSFLLRTWQLKAARLVLSRALKALPMTLHSRIWEVALEFVGKTYRLLPKTAMSLWERYLQLAPDRRGDYVVFLRDRQENYDAAARELVLLANSLIQSTEDLQAAADRAQEQRKRRQQTEEEAAATPDAEESDEDELFTLKKGVAFDDAADCWDALCELVIDHAHKVTSVPVESIFRTALSVFKKDQGRYWTAFATYKLRIGDFDGARAVFEEALGSVFMVRDFAQIFDSYSKMEEALLGAFIERSLKKKKPRKAPSSTSEAVVSEPADERLLQQMTRLEALISRHSLLLNDVLLRQNPHSTDNWLKRVEIVKEREEPLRVLETFEEALKTVSPRKAPGVYPQLWSRLAEYLERDLQQPDDARTVYKRATAWDAIAFANVGDLAAVYLAWSEMELRCNDAAQGEKAAIDVLAQAIAPPPAKKAAHEAYPQLHRSLAVWNAFLDLEEARGASAAIEAAYERLLQLRLAQPQHIINYAHWLEEGRGDLDAAFRVYERGIELFGYPVAFEIWNIYLPKFVARYAADRLERTRDLFETALGGCPEKFAKALHLLYARVEEEHGLQRNALKIYKRACAAVSLEQKAELYGLYAAKTTEWLGLLATRDVYEEAIKVLPQQQALDLVLRYAAMEEKLGETERARALLLHAAPFCDPRTGERFWGRWQEFETRHGNEQSFREMLRVKRAVANDFLSKLPYVPASVSDSQPVPPIEESAYNEEEVALDV
jgi:pre-mRNA-splicing factor SYF1